MATGANDWAADGLLEGLEGRARTSRRLLLDELAALGVDHDELRAAAREGRLAALPAEVLLGGAARWSAREAAEHAGLDLEFVLAVRRANGIAGHRPRRP